MENCWNTISPNRTKGEDGRLKNYLKCLLKTIGRWLQGQLTIQLNHLSVMSTLEQLWGYLISNDFYFIIMINIVNFTKPFEENNFMNTESYWLSGVTIGRRDHEQTIVDPVWRMRRVHSCIHTYVRHNWAGDTQKQVYTSFPEHART